MAHGDRAESQTPSSIKQNTDEELVKASQQGDITAFGRLVCQYHRQVFSLIYQLTHNREIVEDIAQEVFLAAFKAIKEFEGRSSFFTWLYRITVNHCKNYLATVKSHYSDSQYYSEQVEQSSHEPEHNPLRMLLAKELIEHVEQAITALPEEQRVVLVLCEFEGLSYQEIAEILGCPIGTVRSRLARARMALQEYLHEFLE